MRNLLALPRTLAFALALAPLAACLPPVRPQPLYAELPRPQVIVTDTSLVLNQAIFFEFGKDRILPLSHPILDEVGRALREHPDLSRVRIEGHTDNRGAPTYNLNLSQRRAQAVQRYLEQEGVPAGRLTAVGYGLSQPIADNGTEDGRARNRRVAFVIEKRADGPRHAQR